MNVAAFVRPPAGLHAIAVKELSSPRYRWSTDAPASKPWWQRIAEWIAGRWNDVVHAVFGRVHGGGWPAIAGDIVLVLAILLVVVFAVRFLLSISLDRKRYSSAEPLTGSIASSEWYRRAIESASRGDFTYASRCILGAAVALLHERGAIDPSAGATIGELRRELLASAPQYASSFWTIARIFAIGAYAERPLDRAEFDGAAGAYRSLAGQT
jgi:hypothetical protein